MRDGSAGERSVVIELPRRVPDGIAFDAEGSLYISLYNPNIIYRLTPRGLKLQRAVAFVGEATALRQSRHANGGARAAC